MPEGPTIPAPAPARAARYAAWVDRHRRAILLASLVLASGAGLVAAGLPVYSDFSHLLPPGAQSVKDLHALEKRARGLGTLMIAVKSRDPARRQAVAHKLKEELQALGPALVSNLTFDESVARRFGWDHRWLFAPLGDLAGARDALRAEIDQAKLRANPLYIELEDEPPSDAGDRAALDELRHKLREAEAKRADPGELVSKDGSLQLLILHTPFSAGDVDRDGALLDAVDRLVQRAQAEEPAVQVGVAGDVAVSKAEHDAILHGMLFATLLTVLLCVGALALFYRTVFGVLAQSWALAVGTLLAFAFARVTIGHLNLATAFLSSIVVGNGINFGILLLARHLEERRAGRQGLDALAVAISGTLRGTLAAALTASVAYGSLVVTAFRGFRHFGIIGGAGMLLCWASTFTVLPALLAVAERRSWIKPRSEPALGRFLVWMLPRRAGAVAAVVLALGALAGFETWRYLAHDPYEANFKNLRSDNSDLRRERQWMHEIDEAFGQGISGGFAIALDDPAQARALAARLRAVDQGKPEDERLFSRVNTLDDMLPADQPQKLEVLAQIRALLDDDTLNALSEADRADALALRPPADLKPLGQDDLPELLAGPYIEADGSRGKLILAMSGWGYEIWNAHDLVRFSRKVRALDLPEGALLGGSAFVFADMLALIEHDGPLATLAALLGALLVVSLVVGLRRHGAVVLVCCAVGTLLMVAIGALAGLRVNFLDFVALPITIGIGIDYSVNIATRERQEGRGSARRALATTGGAVFLCSYTTIVGYGSLLLSVNQGIRSFGSAAILGEVTCLATALFLAPALLSLRTSLASAAPTGSGRG